jgi:cell division septum initiation protein DivIVA
MPEAEPWHTEETANAAESPPISEATESSSPTTEEAAPAPGSADYHPGFDADAFGYHGTEYQEEETPYGYRYEWPPAEVAPASPAAEESTEPADTWSPQPMDEMKPTHEQSEPLASAFSAPDQPASQPSSHETVGSHVPTGAGSQPAAESASRFVTEELAGILTAAEDSAARIIERARETADRQLERSNRMWSEVQVEVARFASWRDEVEPVIRTVQSKVENVRSFIEEVPERIREALAPMAESISSIDSDLAELSAACNPPLLLTPSALQAEGEDQSSSGGGSPEPDAGHDGSHSDPFRGSSFGYSAG